MTLPVHVGKTVVVVHNMDTGVKTAVQTGFDMERTGVASEKERIALGGTFDTKTLVEF